MVIDYDILLLETKFICRSENSLFGIIIKRFSGKEQLYCRYLCVLNLIIINDTLVISL